MPYQMISFWIFQIILNNIS